MRVVWFQKLLQVRINDEPPELHATRPDPCGSGYVRGQCGSLMPRGPCTFRQRDVTRAAKGLRAAGYGVGGVQVNRDGFRIIVTNVASGDNDLDCELTEFKLKRRNG